MTKAEDEDAKRKANLKRAGIGLGIGSAALAAALMYNNYAKNAKKAGAKPSRPENAPPTD